MEQMVVTIKDGNVIIEVEGAKGTRCLQLTQAIEKPIGKVKNRLLKKDFCINGRIEQTLCLKQFNNDKSL